MPAVIRMKGIFRETEDRDIFTEDYDVPVSVLLSRDFGLDRNDIDYIPVVNGIVRDPDWRPSDGDVIVILPLTAGG